MIIRPPIAKQKRYPALMLTVLHAREPEGPVGRPHIDWKLITDLPVDGHDAAVEKLQWYAMRWKIEVFHKMLKSGCRAEQARLRTAERLVRLLAVFCILSWRVFWLTMLNRAKPDLEPDLVPTVLETNILDRLIPDPTADPSPAKTLSLYLIKIAQARARYPRGQTVERVRRPLPLPRLQDPGRRPDALRRPRPQRLAARHARLLHRRVESSRRVIVLSDGPPNCARKTCRWWSTTRGS